MLLTRREFNQYCLKLVGLLGLGSSQFPRIASGLESLNSSRPPVLWIQGQSCSGCSVSLLNTVNPGPAEFLTRHISLKAHQTLSSATGDLFNHVVKESIKKGGMILVVEGSVPEKMPKACLLGGQPIGNQILQAAKQAKIIVAVGTCAAFGGIPAAQNNPTGAVSLPDFLANNQIKATVIRLPGCPSHPDWVVGTLVYALTFKNMALDDLGRPTMFYGKLIHDHCQRFSDYERENFAKFFGDDGCLYQLGCLGPNTHGDCTVRNWNQVNSCIKAGAPCIGCTSKDFAADRDFSFYRLKERYSMEMG